MGPGAAAVFVLPVVVVAVLVCDGVWLQSRLTDEVTLAVLSSPRTPEMSDSGIWPASTPALTGTSLLQAWSGIWLPLAFTRLSLLKPLVLFGPAAWATGADTPTRAAVATASAKARFLRDMLVFPQKGIYGFSTRWPRDGACSSGDST